MNYKLLRQVKRDFFYGNPVRAVVKLEGQSLDDNGHFLLGCKAGPGFSITNLFHEMGHLAEREIPKLLERPNGGWGYTYGKYWEVFNQSGHEPQTDASTMREARCFAFQYSLMTHYGMTGRTVSNLVLPAPYINSWCIYQRRVLGPIPDYEPGSAGTTIRDREAKALQIYANEVAQMANTEFSFERFVDAWNIRMEALKKEEQITNSLA